MKKQEILRLLYHQNIDDRVIGLLIKKLKKVFLNWHIENLKLCKKAFLSVLPAQFILCYNLLQVFLSHIFDLMRVRNMREKDITVNKC